MPDGASYSDLAAAPPLTAEAFVLEFVRILARAAARSHDGGDQDERDAGGERDRCVR